MRALGIFSFILACFMIAGCTKCAYGPNWTKYYWPWQQAYRAPQVFADGSTAFNIYNPNTVNINTGNGSPSFPNVVQEVPADKAIMPDWSKVYVPPVVHHYHHQKNPCNPCPPKCPDIQNKRPSQAQSEPGADANSGSDMKMQEPEQPNSISNRPGTSKQQKMQGQGMSEKQQKMQGRPGVREKQEKMEPDTQFQEEPQQDTQPEKPEGVFTPKGE